MAGTMEAIAYCCWPVCTAAEEGKTCWPKEREACPMLSDSSGSWPQKAGQPISVFDGGEDINRERAKEMEVVASSGKKKVGSVSFRNGVFGSKGRKANSWGAAAFLGEKNPNRVEEAVRVSIGREGRPNGTEKSKEGRRRWVLSFSKGAAACFGKAKGRRASVFFQREGGDQLVSGARKIKPGSGSGRQKCKPAGAAAGVKDRVF
ncbi:hypothetical protein NC652_034101 [Populus alba x Populus x berolinensis]|nr:hypothetical protein NC652_034101 [Populus alba x Populus x berolinensis]